VLNGTRYEWDIVCDGDQWRHYHNYVHHTFTNVVGKDRDVGYGWMRMAEQQPWHPGHFLQPLGAVGLMLFFQWGVGMHDLELDNVLAGKVPLNSAMSKAKPFLRKVARQLLKDYVLFPVLAGPVAPLVLAGNLSANAIRNIWTFLIIFCGHFPEDVRMYTPDEVEGETRAAWYLRQIRGSANIEGSRWFHVLSGNLSHQIEHHLFPDLPACRYAQIAPEVRAICRKYGITYATGSFSQQIRSVAKRVLRLARPTLRRPLSDSRQTANHIRSAVREIPRAAARRSPCPVPASLRPAC
jgi:fatty acid desaturase